MYVVTKETLKQAHKPYDIVRFPDKEIAFIKEVSVNNCQETPAVQIRYSLEFISENEAGHRNAWYSGDEFEVLCNMFVKIAQCSANPMGSSEYWVKKVLINK